MWQDPDVRPDDPIIAAALPIAPSCRAPVRARLAVVDLSSPKAPSVAEVLRRTQRTAMSTSRTNAAVSDAESLGIICSVDDVQCLEKPW